MKTTNRIISFFLSVLLCFSIFSISQLTTFAEETAKYTYDGINYVCSVVAVCKTNAEHEVVFHPEFSNLSYDNGVFSVTVGSSKIITCLGCEVTPFSTTETYDFTVTFDKGCTQTTVSAPQNIAWGPFESHIDISVAVTREKADGTTLHNWVHNNDGTHSCEYGCEEKLIPCTYVDNKCSFCGDVLDVLGDADGDGYITIIDATLIQRHLAELITIPESDIIICDVNKSGDIDIMDATAIQLFVCKIQPNNGVGELLG